MARGLNKVMLIGNLGADPEVRYTAGGSAVANVRLATADTWRDKDSGETQERTEWHRVVFYSRLAEIAGEYLRKGSKIFIEGRLQTRKWQDKTTNQDRYTTEIIADSMQMLDSKGSNSGNSNHFGDAPHAAEKPEADQAQPQPAVDNFDDDIPF